MIGGASCSFASPHVNSGIPEELPSAMARQQTAFDLGSAWLLDYERRPPALGWSHAAGGGGQVSGPVHAHNIFARLGQGDCQGSPVTADDSSWRGDD